MPFDNNPLDDLFRAKDKELPPDTRRMDAHWDQMQRLLVPAVPVKKPLRTFRPWMAGLLVAITGAALFFILRGKNEPSANTVNTALAKQETPELPPAITISSEKDNQQPAQQKAISTAAAPAAKPVNQLPVTATIPVTANVKKRVNNHEYIELPQEPQVFHISADQDTAILCKHGTTIKIPGKSLADAVGNTVTGEVTMIVQEYYRYEDIIAAGLNRNAKMKEKSITAGMVKFDAYRDEEKLDVKPGCSIEIRMRKDLINVKAGEKSRTDAGSGDGDKMQELNIHNLGWISYERFYNDTRPVTTIRVQIPKNVDVNQLISQLAFISVQGVMPGYIENNQVVFYNIPVGEKAWFISLGATGEKFLSCVEQLEIKGNDLITPLFREASPEQFKRQLEMLTALPVKEQ